MLEWKKKKEEEAHTDKETIHSQKKFDLFSRTISVCLDELTS